MQIILPFGNPIISQNPIDAMEMSVIDAYNAYYSLMDNCLDTCAFEFVDNGKYYYDTHFSDNLSIFDNQILEVEENNFLKTVIEKIQQSYYVLLELDWSKIHFFKREKFFQHSVTIFGFDDEEEIFYIADFSSTGAYQKIKAGFSEIEDAYYSVVNHHRSEHKKEEICIRKFVDNKDKTINCFSISNKINLFLNNLCSENNYNQWKNTSIPRISEHGVYYEIKPLAINYGKDVLIGSINHARKCLENECYIYEKKSIYLIYAFISLLNIRATYLKDNNYLFAHKDTFNKIVTLATKINDLFKSAQPLLLYSTKYEIKHDKTTLKKIITKLEELTERYVLLLVEFCSLIDNL